MFTKCISDRHWLVICWLVAVAMFFPRPSFAQIGTDDPNTNVSASSPNIIGGNEVQPIGKYPFMVAISRKGLIDFHNTYEGHECGCTLIHPLWVLTAGEVQLNWQGVEHASNYEVVVANDTGLPELTVVYSATVPVAQTTLNLEVPGRYVWQVRALSETSDFLLSPWAMAAFVVQSGTGGTTQHVYLPLVMK